MIAIVSSRSYRLGVACAVMSAALSACGWVDSAGRQSNENPIIQVMVDNELLDENQSVVIVESGSREIDLSSSSDSDGKVVAYHGSLSGQGKLGICEQWIDLQTAANLIGEACEPDVSSESCNLYVINKGQANEGDGTPTEVADGQFTVVSPPLASPIGMTYRWTVVDNDGGESSRDVTFCLTTINDVPVAANDFYQVASGKTLNIPDIVYNADCSISSGAQSVLGNDTDNTDLSGNCLQAELLELPDYAVNDFAGDFTTFGGFSYTHGGAGGADTDSFSYRVYDAVHYSDPATVTITIEGSTNLPPIAGDDQFNVIKNTRNNKLYVTANDSDPEQQPLTITKISKQPDQGGSARISAAGYILYTPNQAFTGLETFDYTISDAGGKTATAKVQIMVEGLNSPPEPVADSFTVSTLAWHIFDVLANDSDAEDDNLTIISVTQPTKGSFVTVSSDGQQLLYYPSDKIIDGADSFIYTVEDTEGAQGSATVTVSFIAPPQAGTR